MQNNSINNALRVGILGAAGYTGGELIRLLINHPNVESIVAYSESNEGNLISDVHEGLIGDTELRFSSLPLGGVGGGCLGGQRGALFFTNEVRYFLCEAYILYDVWMATIVVSLCGVVVQELVLKHRHTTQRHGLQYEAHHTSYHFFLL